MAQLPDEIWGEAADCADYSWFFRLQLVCKRFKIVFSQQSHYYSSLILHKNLDGCGFEGLLRWVQFHRASMDTVVASCSSPWMQAA